MIKWLKEQIIEARRAGVERCNDWAGNQVLELNPNSLLDVGCGSGELLWRYLKKRPDIFHGIECDPESRSKAKEKDILTFDMNLNRPWNALLKNNTYDVVFSNQVIEHLHNTLFFVKEMYRVTKNGGTAIVTSENLGSLINCLALNLGYTPFSLMGTCGHYLGNPLGLHYNEKINTSLSESHSSFSGASGHVRVLTCRQAKEIFELAGFKSVEVNSISILPFHDKVSQVLEKIIKERGHYMTIKARKII